MRRGICLTGVGMLLLIVLVPAWAKAAKRTGSLRGRVTDPSGAVVAGAAITVTLPDGQIRRTVSDRLGNYTVRGLPEGNVTVGATAPGFAAYERPDVIIRAGQAQQLDIALGIAVKQEQVTVESESGVPTVSLSPENNASAVVLKGEELEALPDDPDELEQDLLALAGPSVGPNGGQIYIDGFSNGTLPPKSSIEEIQINQNPFSAEYDKPGYGRIEVITKPGTNHWHGKAMFDEQNSVFNSRNPYVLPPVPGYHSEVYEGYVSGALNKKMSVFLNAQRRDIRHLDVVAARVLPPNGEAVLSPRVRDNVAGRLDWQLAPNNRLTARYQFESNHQENLGIGGITLPARGYLSDVTEHTLQISDMQILSANVIDETRFQFIRNQSSQIANQSGAAIDVLGEFSTGGSTVGQSVDTMDRYELQNNLSWAKGRHYVKFGGRLRAVHDDSVANTNFNGTFTFGNTALSPSQNYANGTPTQFSIVAGNPRYELSFADAAAYAEDDWKLRPNLVFSYGLRVETQSAIHDKADFAPRVVLSWGLGGGKSKPKTVLRFGYGIFYDRFTEDLVLQAERQNGTNQEQFVIANPSGYPGLPCDSIPSCEALAGSSLASPTIYQINPRLRAPYTMQTGMSLERQLGRVGTLSLIYLNSIGEHQLILENVNTPCAVGSMPFPGCAPGTRPLAAQYGNDNIYQYNSEAIFRQNQLIASMLFRISNRISLMGYYVLNYANSDTGGPSSSPSNQYNLLEDYGRASFDVRHRLFLVGSASLAHNIRISPFVLIHSGAPFNIATGSDNGDTFFNQRPSFGTPGAPGVVTTPYGSFNVNPAPGERPIPINYGNGPANATVNVRISKTFGFGPQIVRRGRGPEHGPGGYPHGGHGGAPGVFRPSHSIRAMLGPGTTGHRYNLTLTMTARNVFNTWNPGPPIGTLSPTCTASGCVPSPMFGKSVTLAAGPFSNGTANRRVDFQALFSF